MNLPSLTVTNSVGLVFLGSRKMIDPRTIATVPRIIAAATAFLFICFMLCNLRGGECGDVTACDPTPNSAARPERHSSQCQTHADGDSLRELRSWGPLQRELGRIQQFLTPSSIHKLHSLSEVRGVNALRTDELGTVEFITDGERLGVRARR